MKSKASAALVSAILFCEGVFPEAECGIVPPVCFYFSTKQEKQKITYSLAQVVELLLLQISLTEVTFQIPAGEEGFEDPCSTVLSFALATATD